MFTLPPLLQLPLLNLFGTNCSIPDLYKSQQRNLEATMTVYAPAGKITRDFRHLDVPDFIIKSQFEPRRELLDTNAVNEVARN